MRVSHTGRSETYTAILQSATMRVFSTDRGLRVKRLNTGVGPSRSFTSALSTQPIYQAMHTCHVQTAFPFTICKTNSERLHWMTWLSTLKLCRGRGWMTFLCAEPPNPLRNSDPQSNNVNSSPQIKGLWNFLSVSQRMVQEDHQKTGSITGSETGGGEGPGPHPRHHLHIYRGENSWEQL